MPGVTQRYIDRITEAEFLVRIGVNPGLASETAKLLDTDYELAAQVADETGLERRDKEPFASGVKEMMDPDQAPHPQSAAFAERALALYRMADALGLAIVSKEVA